MPTYPVHIHVKSYSGKNPKLIREYQARIEAGSKIEAYLNEQVKEPGWHTFTYHDIAEATYLSKETVKEILFRFDGGSNGITVFREEPPKGATT